MTVQRRSERWEFDQGCIVNSWDKRKSYGSFGPKVENIKAQIHPETQLTLNRLIDFLTD